MGSRWTLGRKTFETWRTLGHLLFVGGPEVKPLRQNNIEMFNINLSTNSTQFSFDIIFPVRRQFSLWTVVVFLSHLLVTFPLIREHWPANLTVITIRGTYLLFTECDKHYLAFAFCVLYNSRPYVGVMFLEYRREIKRKTLSFAANPIPITRNSSYSIQLHEN